MDLRLRNPAPVVIAGAVIAAIAWFGLVPFILPLGLALLAAGAAAWIFKPERPTAYWRGRVIDMSENLSPWGRVYYKLFKD